MAPSGQSLFLYRLSSLLRKKMMLLDSLDSNWKMGLEHFYLLEGGEREGGRFNDEQKVPKR